MAGQTHAWVQRFFMLHSVSDDAVGYDWEIARDPIGAGEFPIHRSIWNDATRRWESTYVGRILLNVATGIPVVFNEVGFAVAFDDSVIQFIELVVEISDAHWD
eukprot:90591-Karenia_brevis.AAC.1